MKKHSVLHVLTLIIVIINVIFLSCKESTKSEEEIILPESNITFFKHMQKLFNVKCATPGCHSYVDREADLDLTNYNEIMIKNVENVRIVIPEFGEQSFLYQILLQDYNGRRRMPLYGPYLNANNTNGVKVWIDEGAKP